MKFTKYMDALTSTKEENDKALAAGRANVQNAELGLKIDKLKLEISKLTGRVEQLASQHPLPIDEILDATNGVEWEKRRLEQLETLRNALFPK